MKADIDCIPCILTQGMNTVRRVTDDPAVQREVMDYIMDRLRVDKLDKTPADHSNLAYEAVRQVTGQIDPFKDEKRELNRVALKLYPELKQLVAESDKPLHTALKIAVAGNMIDLGIGHGFDIERDLTKILSEEFAIDDYSDFCDSANSADTIMYVGDNCGEIVFDRVLAEQLGPEKVAFVVKGGPIINDATIEDANQVGLDKLCPVLATANNLIGLPPTAMTPKIRHLFETADMIISKGQGNFETLSDIPKNIFFMLKAKCSLVAAELAVKYGQVVLVHQRNLPKTNLK